MSEEIRTGSRPVRPAAFAPPDAPSVVPGPAGTSDAGPQGDITLFTLLQILRRQRVAILLIAASAVAVAIVPVLVRPRVFASEVAFIPQTRSPESSVSGLAAQFGLALPTTARSETPQFYLELLRARPVLRDVVEHTYVYSADTGEVRGTLIDIWSVSGESESQRLDAAMRRLTHSIDASASSQTGIVRVSIRAADPELARQIGDRIVNMLNQFNLQSRRSQAMAEREFVEARLEAVASDLRGAENRLQLFLQQNRGSAQAPALRFEQDRLTRDLDLHRQLYTTLAQAFEQAKIDEVRNTPVITIVEPPEAASRPEPRGLLRTLAVALLAGTSLGLLVGLLRELMASYRRQRAATLFAVQRLS